MENPANPLSMPTHSTPHTLVRFTDTSPIPRSFYLSSLYSTSTQEYIKSLKKKKNYIHPTLNALEPSQSHTIFYLLLIHKLIKTPVPIINFNWLRSPWRKNFHLGKISWILESTGIRCVLTHIKFYQVSCTSCARIKSYSTTKTGKILTSMK